MKYLQVFFVFLFFAYSQAIAAPADGVKKVNDALSDSNKGTTQMKGLMDIHKALIGKFPTANLHDDLAQLKSVISNQTIGSAQQSSSLFKAKKFREDAAMEAKAATFNTPAAKEEDCQAALATQAIATASPSTNKTTVALVKAKTARQAKRVSLMRNQSEDKEAEVAVNDEMFCSEEDSLAGLCAEENVCDPASLSCKSGANKSAMLFMADHYDSIAHQEGAEQFITNLVNPFPKQAKKKLALLNEDLDNTSYLYKQSVESANESVPYALLNFLWGYRANIFEPKSVPDEQAVTRKFLTQVSSYDKDLEKIAAEHISFPFRDSGYVSLTDKKTAFVEDNGGVTSAVASDIEAPLVGNVSALDLLEMQVKSNFGNTAWETSLTTGDGKGRKAYGRAIALGSKLLFEINRRLDMILMAEAVQLSRGK